MAFEKIKQMISNVKGKMMDDEGLFQGGKYGRVGGRFKDMMDSTVQGGAGRRGREMTQMFGQQDVGPGGVTDLTSSMFDDSDPRLSQDFTMARKGAFDFDPSNPNDVLMMQKRINRLLPEGDQLAEDSMFGPKTESALRRVQGMMNKEGGAVGGLMGFTSDELPGYNPPQYDPADPGTLGDFMRGPMTDYYDQNPQVNAPPHLGDFQYEPGSQGRGTPPEYNPDDPGTLGDFMRGPMKDYYDDNPQYQAPPHLKDFYK